MTYVITQNCCKDASCVSVCPVNCIHPAPTEAGFAAAPMLYIDPGVCISCGACADACPVGAAVPADTLSGVERVYVDVNAQHYTPTQHHAPAQPETTSGQTGTAGPLFRSCEPPVFDWSLPSHFAGLDVAVVGTGPAGLYAAELLLLHSRSTVTLIDRLPVAGGLIRHGVAPDHPGTKRIGHAFGRLYSHPRVRLLLGVDVGTDVAVEELTRSFDAIVYAVGASSGRTLGVPGDALPGNHTAPEFVGWYNAHPDQPVGAVRLPSERAVVVGTGNVALDIARILAGDPAQLAGTDIADHALATLQRSPLREVVLLGRRGPAQAAYSAPELLGLRALDGVELVVDDPDGRAGAAIDDAPAGEHAALLRGVRRAVLDYTAAPGPGRRIVLRFHSTVDRVLGEDAVRGVRLLDGTDVLAAPLISAIGYVGTAIPGLPSDPVTGTVPNEAGRIDGVPGAYAVGWCKRGSTGGIGHNRVDAAETVRTLFDDAVAGRLPSPAGTARTFRRAVRRSHPDVVDAAGLDRILRAERARGRASGRPSVKYATLHDLVRASRRR
ncbi:FAD-dependent oxidoreductase [Geodermatophilus aquaeductus]|uniref:ferredoxin--NADP(+) reductase n=1 Tax=Geodermatophilus aquaeductus TaxID=1564161 RepID=A0A521FJG2_9ACTN|nr:FAD-dependent oxidoreductase [Geodermatophilus aquaeductus]SMO96249.1 ferredoxin--NADP+ reductase [Geodermatophilus aquaeductus]